MLRFSLAKYGANRLAATARKSNSKYFAIETLRNFQGKRGQRDLRPRDVPRLPERDGRGRHEDEDGLEGGLRPRELPQFGRMPAESRRRTAQGVVLVADVVLGGRQQGQLE